MGVLKNIAKHNPLSDEQNMWKVVFFNDSAFTENTSFILNETCKCFMGKEQERRRENEREGRKSERLNMVRKGLWRQSKT